MARFKRPTLEEVAQYCRERGNQIDPEQWYDHYTANGWKVGRASMKDWRAAVRTWERMRRERQGKPESALARLQRENAERKESAPLFEGV